MEKFPKANRGENTHTHTRLKRERERETEREREMLLSSSYSHHRARAHPLCPRPHKKQKSGVVKSKNPTGGCRDRDGFWRDARERQETSMVLRRRPVGKTRFYIPIERLHRVKQERMFDRVRARDDGEHRARVRFARVRRGFEERCNRGVFSNGNVYFRTERRRVRFSTSG